MSEENKDIIPDPVDEIQYESKESTPVEQPVNESKPLDLPIKTKKFAQEEQIFSSVDESKHELLETVIGPSDYNDNIPPRLEGKVLNNEDDTVEWAQTVSHGAQTASYDSQFTKPLSDPDADFVQHLEVNGDKLGIRPSRLKSVSNQEIEGEKALMMVKAAFGLGGYVQIPLFHSGFWVTLKAPGENEILELHRQITQDKIELGRATYGLAFSNQVVFFVNRLLDFALNNIHSYSIKTNKDIREFIYSHDVPILIWGIACAIWPNGFKYSRACVHNPGECNHIATELINLSKLLWINKVPLNAWQKSLMLNRSASSVTEEDVIRYRKELLNNQPRLVKIKKDESEISFKLKVPTALEWINEGTSWINSIVETITASFSESTNINERNRHILNSAKASALQQYSHWVEEVEIDTNTVKKKETIEAIIGSLSSDDYVREEFIKKIRDYIDDTVISLIGVPSYDCPSCGKPQDEAGNTLPKFVNIIPIDVYNTFFIPLVQRVIKITNR